MASNEKKIWDFFKSKGLSDTFTAAFIGNLWYESGQNLEYGSTCKEGAGNGSSSASQQYTNSVNNKSYSEYSFVNDGIGYGLAQWTYYSRKQGLYNYTIENGLSIGDLETQLNYLVTEYEYKKTIEALNKLSPAEKNDIDICTRVVCEVFESPGVPHLSERQSKANSTYTSYAGSSPSTSTSSAAPVSSSPQSIPYGEALVAAAESEVIYWNNTYGENGYENNNKYTTWFYGREQPADWCAIFVSYCVNEAGVTLPFNPSDYECVGGGNGASPVEGQGCDAVSPWMVGAKETGCWVDVDDLQPGDIVVYSDYHIGIVYSGYGASALTIEGNVSGGEGRLRKYTYVYDTPRLGGIRLNGMSSKVLSSGSNLSVESSDPIYNSQSSGLSFHEVEVEIKASHIATADADANTLRTKSNSLLDTPTLVESPFIILKIGNYTFGSYSANGSFEAVNSSIRVTYPNYMTNIRITKVNGQVNQYVITMVYQIENGNDPNLLDKIFSSVGYGTVLISYGDWNAPKFAYRDEEAIITRLDSNVDFSNSRITYTLYCTSNALMLMGGYYNFPYGNVKPSDEIYKMMYAEENTYHLQDIFTAFKGNEDFFWKCVASDDVVVEVVPKIGMDALSYVNYLVTCMSPTTTPKGSPIRDANYYLTICEDRDSGTYFTVKKVSSTADIISLNNSDVYEVDVGYPGDTLVTQFRINSDNSWDLLYHYSDNIRTQDYIYNIDAQGKIYENYSPNITTSAKYLRTTETQRNWWTQMTQFPITAILTIKGLLRPAMLMSYVRVNAMFYGLRHVSSGLYIIIKQEDTVDINGYRTTLTLQRIAGDLDTIVTETKNVTKLVPDINYNVTESWVSKGGSYGGINYSSSGHQFTGGGRAQERAQQNVNKQQDTDEKTSVHLISTTSGGPISTIVGTAASAAAEYAVNEVLDYLTNSPQDERDYTDYMIP